MAKEIHQWSPVDNDNQFTPADGGCAEGWLGADVNNAARARMGAQARAYIDQEFARILTGQAPFGTKAITRDSNTQFRLTNGTDYTALFPVGRRIRVYDNAAGFVDVFVNTRAFGAPNTTVTINGGPNLPAVITDIGFHTDKSLAPFVFGGIGNTAARNAIYVNAPPDGIFWINTDLNDVQVSMSGTWSAIGHIGSFTNAGALLTLLSSASFTSLMLQRANVVRLQIHTQTSTFSEIAHTNAGSVTKGQLQLDDDGNLYYIKSGGGRKNLTPELLTALNTIEFGGEPAPAFSYGGKMRATAPFDKAHAVQAGPVGYSVGTILAQITMPAEILVAVDNSKAKILLGIRSLLTSGADSATMAVGVFQTAGSPDPSVDTLLHEMTLPSLAINEAVMVDQIAMSLPALNTLYCAYRQHVGGPIGTITFKAPTPIRTNVASLAAGGGATIQLLPYANGCFIGLEGWNYTF